MFTLANDRLEITVNPKGAELTRVYSKGNGLDYLWNGDPAYWPKHSPILFPIVGALRNDQYIFDGKHYTLPRHGFAREMNFEMTGQDGAALTFTLNSDASTLKIFPFDFRLEVIYTLAGNNLKTGYRVTNTGPREMYFSIGGHPAFRVPIEKGQLFEDYFLEFDTIESAGRWPVSPQGLIEALPVTFFQDSKVIKLSHELFSNDALVFKYLNSKWVKLLSNKSAHGLAFHFEHFPLLGIWSGNNGDFVCIEPWCGIADGVASDQQLIEKEGINIITPGQTFEREWSVEFF